MNRITAVVATVAALAVPATPAVAAKAPPKPKCPFVSDAKGDAGYPVAQGPQQGDLDIVTADIASDAKVVTVVFGFDQPMSSLTNYKMVWRFTPKGSAVSMYVAAIHDAVNGSSFQVGTYNDATRTYTPGANTPDVVTGAYDAAKKEMHVTAKLTAFPVKLPRGLVVSNFTVETAAWSVPYYGQLVPLAVDSATSKTTYALGGPSCVKPGA